MRANEVLRSHCGDCQAVFDLRLDHVREVEVTGEPPLLELAEPTCCPFCGAGELSALHERAAHVAANAGR
jgi:hypothetical protein